MRPYPRVTALTWRSAREPFAVKGSRIVKDGRLGVYPYGRGKDVEVPRLQEGEEVQVERVYDEQKETQPPGRYGQGRLIELMEQNGLAPRPPATA